MQCKNCSKEFEGKRKSAQFCSSKCRKLAFLKSKVSVPVVSVPTSKTDDFIKKYGQFCQKNGDRIQGQCRWCGKEITEKIYGNNWNLVECCYDCTAKRNNQDRNLYPAD